MNRRSYLKSAGVAATAGLLAGCSGPGNSEDAAFGTLETSVTDQPADIEDFESCIVTIDGIWVIPLGADGTATDTTATETTGTEADDGDEGRRYIEFEESQTADLVQLQGNNTQSLGESEVETGTYEKLQLDVSGVEGTLDDGSEAEVDTPGNAPLQFNAEFEIRAGETTRFIADFTPVRQGNTGRYILQPVASSTTVLYGTETYSGGDSTATEEEERTEDTEAETTDGTENTTSGGNRTAGRSGN